MSTGFSEVVFIVKIAPSAKLVHGKFLCLGISTYCLWHSQSSVHMCLSLYACLSCYTCVCLLDAPEISASPGWSHKTHKKLQTCKQTEAVPLQTKKNPEKNATEKDAHGSAMHRSETPNCRCGRERKHPFEVASCHGALSLKIVLLEIALYVCACANCRDAATCFKQTTVCRAQADQLSERKLVSLQTLIEADGWCTMV